MNFNLIYNDILNNVKESQIKLGYSFADYTLYYPIDALNRIIGQNLNANELNKGIIDECVKNQNLAGFWQVEETKDNRLCIIVPKEGVRYICEKYKNEFLEDFVNVIISKNVSIDDIKSVFEKYSKDYACIKKEDEEELEYVLSFKDKSIDPYVYVVHFELGQVSYHRFLEKEYNFRTNN